MWQNYFLQIQKKYNMRLSTKKPLVIRFDGKDVTKNIEFNLLYNYSGGFVDTLEKAAWYFSNKYNCYAIYGSDEISFIFKDPLKLIKDLDSDECNHSNEVIALFSQYFFDYFNTLFKQEKVFWHGKCFSVSEDKIISYIKYRIGVIKNVMVTYFLKKKDVKITNIKLSEKIKLCEEFKDYIACKESESTLYFSGDKIDIEEFLKGNITKVNKENIEKNDNINEMLKNNDNNIDIEF